MPTELSRDEVTDIYQTIMDYKSGSSTVALPTQFVVERD